MQRGQLVQCSDAPKVKGERHRHFHAEAVQIDAKVKVETTPDYWIIPDTGLTTQGVMNGAFKPKDELAKTWMLANGQPFSHDHPRDEDEYGLIVDLRRVGGFVDNVRFNDETGDVIGDVYLARRPQEGLAITEENIRRNKFLIDAIKAGEQAEVSIGFWSTDEWSPGKHGDAEFEWIQRGIVYDHLASVPLGACSWGMGCGLGRHQNKESERLNEPRGVRGNRAAMTLPTPEAPAAAHNCPDGGVPAANAQEPAAPAPAAESDAFKEMKARLDALEKERQAEKQARLNERRTRLAQLLDKKAEDLPKDLPLSAVDAWIDREEHLQGKADPPLVTGDAARGEPGKGWNIGEEVDGISITPHGMTVTNWSEAEKAHAGRQQSGWAPVGAARAGGAS